MNLVPSEGALGPRIGPKVFADVPSAAELADANARAADARKGRAFLLLLTVLLLGALAAVIAFVVIDRGASQDKIAELTAANTKLTEDAKQATAKADAELKRLQAANAKLVNDFGPYQLIVNQEGQVTELQRQIREKTDQQVYSGFRMTPAERRALDSSAPWPAASLSTVAWKGRVQENLALQVAQLEALRQRVENYVPPITGANTCTDPRKTWPNC
jgi:hypothetical protein